MTTTAAVPSATVSLPAIENLASGDPLLVFVVAASGQSAVVAKRTLMTTQGKRRQASTATKMKQTIAKG